MKGNQSYVLFRSSATHPATLMRQGYFYFSNYERSSIMNKIKVKIATAKIKAECAVIGIKSRVFDTKAEGHVDTAVKIIIGVVIGALVLAGLILLWNTVIMPRLTTEITGMFG
jgi:hypothetical protein